MQQFFADYLDRLASLHTEAIKTIEGLPQTAGDWVPGPDMNSICAIITHIVGAERYWIGDVAMQDPSHRDRASEFRAQGLDDLELKQRLTTSMSYVRKALQELNLSDLELSRTSPRDGSESSVGWALVQALGHTALHVGQIQLTRQLWYLCRNEQS